MSCYVEAPIQQEIESVPSEGYNPFNFPIEGSYLPFFFTDETFTKVLSALVNGAFLTYGDEAMQVIWYFLQNVEFPVDLCEQIAECIENSEATRQALRDLIASDTEIQETLGTSSMIGTLAPETVLAESEDYDALFGAITFLVDTMYDAIVDFNGLAELTTNFRERGALLFRAIPVVETAPVDEVFEFIDTIYEDVMEVFNGQWSTVPITGSRDRIRCGLFCLAKLNGGVITWEMTRDYFWEQVSFVPAGPVVGIAAQFVAFLATGNWVGQAVVDISFANFATAMTLGQKFGDLLFPSLDTIMALGLNNPDSDWITLCTECNVDLWCVNLDFTVDNGGMNAITSSLNGSYVTGQYWESGLDASTTIRQLYIQRILSGDAKVKKMIAKFDRYTSTATDASFRGVALQGYNAGGTQVFNHSTPFTAPQTGTYNDVTYTYDNPAGITIRQFRFLGVPINEAAGVTPAGYLRLKSLEIQGEGFNPFGVSNC